MRRRAGLSLLELMVALVIFVPMFIAITQSMSFVFEVSSEVTIRQIRMSQYNQLYYFLNRDLSQAEQITVRDNPVRMELDTLVSADLRVMWTYVKADQTVLRTAMDRTTNTIIQGPSEFLDNVTCSFAVTTVFGESAVAVSVDEPAGNNFSLRCVFGGEMEQRPTVLGP